jgi:hypothetical protein
MPSKLNSAAIAVAFVAGLSVGAVTLSNHPAFKPKTGPVAAVSATKMNMFYVGVDNPVEIAVSGFPADSVEVAITSGTIEQVGHGQYIVKDQKPGQTTVSVSVRTQGASMLVGEKTFRVSRIPDPRILLGNRMGPVIRANELKPIDGLVAASQNFPFEMSFPIRSFTVTHRSAKDDSDPPLLTEIRNEGNLFNARVRHLFQ